MLVEFEYKTLRTTLELGMELTIDKKDLSLSLNGLDEWHKSTLDNTKLIQHQ